MGDCLSKKQQDTTRENGPLKLKPEGSKGGIKVAAVEIMKSPLPRAEDNAS